MKKWNGKLLGVSLAILGSLFVTAHGQTISVPNPGEVSFLSGQVYQGGSRRKGIKATASQVTLPNLNDILSASPTPSPTPKITHFSPVSPRSTSETGPKFGFGAGNESSSEPSGPTGLDGPAVIDPGYQPQPRPGAENWEPAQPSTQINIRDSVIHINGGNAGLAASQPPAVQAYSFAHQYYPRSYYYQVPCVYPAYLFNNSCFGGGYPYCHPYPSALSCPTGLGWGSFYTSSRAYLSGFGRCYRPGFHWGFRF